MELRKTWILRLDGTDTHVTVVQDGSGHGWVETSEGDTIADALVLDGGRTVSIRRGGRMYLVDLTPVGVSPLAALVNGRGGTVEILDELAAAAAEHDASSPAQSELRSQMPGLVVEVKAEVGQKVAPGDPLVVLEAMKMQNELGSPGEGVVEQVLVGAGDSVDSGTLLVRLAALEAEAR